MMPKLLYMVIKRLMTAEMLTLDKHENITTLLPNHRQVFWQKMLALCLNDLLPKSLLVFRGESRKNLSKKLFLSNNDIPVDEHILARLFYFGDKAKYYYASCSNSVQSQKQVQWLKNIRDNSDESNRKIFAQIKKLLEDNSRDQVLTFNRKRPIFMKFFSDSNNILVWLSVLKENIVYRDYYLCFLHTYGNKGMPGRTFQVSSTRDWQTAREFSKNEFIIYYVLPFINTNNGFSICPATSSKIERELNEKQMPTYAGTTLYPSQREITLKGCMFPHLIWGVHDQRNSRFIVNPHMFVKKQNYKNPFLSIDQSAFEKKLNNTNYLKAVFFDGDFFDIESGNEVNIE